MGKCTLVKYFGSVQGVGFRYTARALAERFRVSGYVKNITDGSVELLAQGDAAEVDAFLAAIDERMGELVARKEIAPGPPGEGRRGFAIRF